MNQPTASIDGFQARYCAMHELDRRAFVIEVLGKSVHQPWRWLWPIIRGKPLTWFYRDYELILAVSRLNNLKEFDAELHEFSHLHLNVRGVRGRLRRRVSTESLRAVFLDTIGQETRTYSQTSGKSGSFVMDHVTCP